MMEYQDFENKMRNAVMEIGKAGERYAKAKGQSWHLQEMRKVILASCMKESSEKTSAAKETDALSSEAYQVHLRGTKEAIQEELLAKSEYEKWKATYESLRSLCSLEKHKITEFGG